MTLTEGVIVATVIIPLIYDVYAVIKGGIRNTISWQFVELSKKYPAIPFFFGYLAGHLTSQM